MYPKIGTTYVATFPNGEENTLVSTSPIKPLFPLPMQLVKMTKFEEIKEGCDVSPVSSRACERGTLGCIVYHDEKEKGEK